MSCQGEGPYRETSGEKGAEPFFASKLSVSAKLETWGVGKLLLAMPIVLESLDEQVAAALILVPRPSIAFVPVRLSAPTRIGTSTGRRSHRRLSPLAAGSMPYLQFNSIVN